MEIHQPGINESDVVASLNSLTGDVTLSAGTNITLNTVGNDITINSASSSTWGSITGDITNQTDLIALIETKQDTLVSGTNIKTINGNSIVGSGDLTVSGGISETLSIAYAIAL